MNRELLEEFIYNETLLSRLYRQISAIAPTMQERNEFLSFSTQASRNAERLNQIYRSEYGTNFSPIIPDTVIQGGYRGLLTEILSMELNSSEKMRNRSYIEPNRELRNELEIIVGNKFHNSIIILSILNNLNSREIENLKNESSK
jgi:hypothetical protein